MLRGILLPNRIVEMFQSCVGGCLGHPPLRLPAFPPTPHHHVPLYSSCYAFLSGHPYQPCLRDPLVSQVLGEWVASSPLAQAGWSEATEVGYPSLIRDKQKEAVKQYACHLFPAPDLRSLLMDLNVPKLGFRHMMEYMSRRGSAYTAATGLPFAKPIPGRNVFTDAWKELVTPLHLRPPVSIPDHPASGRSWPLPSWARCLKSRPSLGDTIDWTRPHTFLMCGDAYPCAGGSWSQLSIGLLNHRAPAYLWVIGMAVCGDKHMAALATIWADNLKVCGPFLVR